MSKPTTYKENVAAHLAHLKQIRENLRGVSGLAEYPCHNDKTKCPVNLKYTLDPDPLIKNCWQKRSIKTVK